MSTRRVRMLAAAVAALTILVGLSACGNRKSVVTSAETEGIYLDVGKLQYQVEISRQLNPADSEDRAYLVGVPNPEGQLRPDETWFAVFIRVSNPTRRSYPAARQFEIEDTVGKKFTPVAVGRDNVFAYRPYVIPPDGTLPSNDSAAGQGPIGGMMLLYKLTLGSLANRPLDFHIYNPQAPAKQAIVELDI